MQPRVRYKKSNLQNFTFRNNFAAVASLAAILFVDDLTRAHAGLALHLHLLHHPGSNGTKLDLLSEHVLGKLQTSKP